MKILKTTTHPVPPKRQHKQIRYDRMHIFRHNKMIKMYLDGRERDLI